ncbi:MAG TPA: methylenetetrahydrofolate reductase [Xanthomonadales bacterium]|nr:methylenetetrahydrofolate reductase [Xanthomonadales bacterium]
MKLAKSSSFPEGRVLEVLRDLAGEASVEVAPRQILAESPLRSLLPAGTRVYVPFLPRAEWATTVEACRALLAQGLEAVPHLPARGVASHGQLDEHLAALREAGVDALLLIAGDQAEPSGPFRDTLEILDTGMLESNGIKRLGVAGHPERHRVASAAALDRALKLKLEYARMTASSMWIVSQFAFDSGRVIGWLERLRSMGVQVPVHVGVPGPASLKTLVAYAAYCGVEASARVLVRRPGAARLLARWTPDGLVQDLAHYRLTHPDSLLRGIHLFSFGGIEQSAQWLHDLSPPPKVREAICTSGVA